MHLMWFVLLVVGLTSHVCLAAPLENVEFVSEGPETIPVNPYQPLNVTGSEETIVIPGDTMPEEPMDFVVVETIDENNPLAPRGKIRPGTEMDPDTMTTIVQNPTEQPIPVVTPSEKPEAPTEQTTQKPKPEKGSEDYDELWIVIGIFIVVIIVLLIIEVAVVFTMQPLIPVKLIPLSQFSPTVSHQDPFNGQHGIKVQQEPHQPLQSQSQAQQVQAQVHPETQQQIYRDVPVYQAEAAPV